MKHAIILTKAQKPEYIKSLKVTLSRSPNTLKSMLDSIETVNTQQEVYVRVRILRTQATAVLFLNDPDNPMKK